MRLEWQATKEEGNCKLSVKLAVEVEGQLASDAKRATLYIEQARQSLDPAFWKDQAHTRAPRETPAVER